MALIKCPKCNKEFSDRAASCPQCGISKGEALSIILEQNLAAEREAAERERLQKERQAIEAEEARKQKELWITVISVLAISIIFCIGFIFF